MLKLLQIGITGGIGSGKSLVSRIFQCFGTPVYDADSRAKYLMTTDGNLITDIKKEFGELSFGSDGSLNRAYLSDVVFNNPVKLSKLNSLVHPRVAEDYRHWVEIHKGHRYILKEAALLFESGSRQTLDKIIVVVAPEVLRIERVKQRDNRPESQIREIIQQQMPDERKQELADFIIKNDETELVIPQVLALHKRFTNEN